MILSTPARVFLYASIFSSLLADPSPEPCSDHPGVNHDPSSPNYDNIINSIVQAAVHTASVALPTHKQYPHHHTKLKKSSKGKKVKLPAVKAPTVQTIAAGTDSVVESFLHSHYLSGPTSAKLKAALTKIMDQALANKVKTVTLPVTKTVPAKFVTLAALMAPTAVPTQESVQIVTLTDTVTSTLTAGSPLSTAVIAASLDIKAAITDAFNAVNMSQEGLTSSTVTALENCLTKVMQSGGMPEGYACLTSSGLNSTGLEATLSTTLEQFVGILPNIIIDNLFNAVTPYLTTLLPASESALVAQIELSIKSVIATLSGSSVTALEQVQSCYTSAIQHGGNLSSLDCFAKGAMGTLETASNSVIESFVGVLPAALITQVQHIITFNLANTTATSSPTLAALVQSQISNAINSAGSTLSGNTVTLAEILQRCASDLIASGNATAAEICLKSSQAPVVSSTVISGIAEQFQGYLPSSFFSDLVTFSTPLLKNLTANPTNATAAQIDGALNTFFNNATSYGPAYVGCILQVEACVTKAIVASGDQTRVCAGPVKGCNLTKGSKVRRAALRRERRRALLPMQAEARA